MSKLKYTKVKTINGKQVLERGLSSEHTFIREPITHTLPSGRKQAGSISLLTSKATVLTTLTSGSSSALFLK